MYFILIRIAILEDYLNKLNEQQRAAVEYLGGPSLVIAGAGSGKTRVLTYKIVHLLTNGYKPYEILALTFTNKAAREMKERIAALIGIEIASQLWMGTFHSIFSRILRFNAEKIGFNHDFTIYDTNDSRSLIKTIIKDMQLDDKTYNASSIQSHISNMKNALISPWDYENDKDIRQSDVRAKRPMTYAIYKTYWNRCRVANAMDFDDLLFYTNILLRDNKDVREKYQEHFKYVLVDEYQDTNFAQHLIVSQLCKKHNNLCVVGDDAQSIYSFRGANISNILNLSRSYPNLKTFKLEQNYRSTQTIIGAANTLIEKNKYQIHKKVFSKSSVGSKIPVIQAYSDYEEGYVVANQIIAVKAIQGGSYENFAILYRTNAQSRVLEEALRKRNIPYRIYGGLSFYQRKEIKDAVSYFRMAINPNDDEALRRIINYPARGIGDTTVGKIQQAAIKHNVSMWAVVNNPIAYELSLNTGTIKKLQNFSSIIQSFIDLNNCGKNALELAQVILRDSTILASVHSDNTPENISKQENLSELLNGIKDFITTKQESGEEDSIALTNFLAEISLATDQDINDENNLGECVTLMTVHAAKGLEFRNVIIVGVEEELFPSLMSCDTAEGVEEERRLLYVAITRAKTNCIITFATSRYRNGQTKQCQMSRFIRDIDPSYLSLSQTSAIASESYSSHHSRGWDFDDYSSKPKFMQSKKPVSIYQQSATPVFSKPTVMTSSSQVPSSDFVSHNVNTLNVGMKIQHSRFGTGIIENIFVEEEKIKVNFSELDETKLLMLKFARFKILK